MLIVVELGEHRVQCFGGPAAHRPVTSGTMPLLDRRQPESGTFGELFLRFP
ncbi:hypothetical protein IU443_06510 [Nocardia farcinica]|uniref:hypothetical protein n=1 Tax=Nocardia TaxID=1817 RepID=UPI0015591901|nr:MULTISPECIES: hypothetical protein [Nocardia]MBF6389596.1 hypothetical protein [Nocardia farcinica]MBF6408136.1 hypothetical protein [Nocardia farcinica]MBF6581337.1 hypothetical protein [Nocardia farcinica]MBF6584846.1 hypothetical protein [Nocardia farcinica]